MNKWELHIAHVFSLVSEALKSLYRYNPIELYPGNVEGPFLPGCELSESF